MNSPRRRTQDVNLRVVQRVKPGIISSQGSSAVSAGRQLWVMMTRRCGDWTLTAARLLDGQDGGWVTRCCSPHRYRRFTFGRWWWWCKLCTMVMKAKEWRFLGMLLCEIGLVLFCWNKLQTMEWDEHGLIVLSTRGIRLVDWTEWQIVSHGSFEWVISSFDFNSIILLHRLTKSSPWLILISTSLSFIYNNNFSDYLFSLYSSPYCHRKIIIKYFLKPFAEFLLVSRRLNWSKSQGQN